MPSSNSINDVLLAALSAQNASNSNLPEDARDWSKLAAVARQHRLEPALHEFLRVRGDPCNAPEDLRCQWSQAFRTATLRSLRNQERLVRINALLSDVGIPFAALKGSWLAYHAYPHPALRPMRDLDILVPASRAIEAYDALLAAGFERMPQYDTPLEFALAAQKHLPPIYCPLMDVVVEVHTSIFMPHAGPDDLPAQIRTDRLLERRVWYPVGGAEIPFLSSTDSLLHLILHAAFDHLFNNGPLVISDIALLLARVPIDWDEFWLRADAGGWSRGCALILHLAGRYHALPPIGWPDGKPVIPPADVAAAALDLMFQDDTTRTKIRLIAELNASRSLPDRVRLLWSRILPPTHVLVAYAGVPRSDANIWRLYPAWLASKLSELARALVASDSRRDAMRTRQVKEWQQST